MTVPLDAIYVTASAKDARFNRICVASIPNFYPVAPFRLLCIGTLEVGLEEELHRYLDVSSAYLKRDDWGWGFVKMEPRFGRAEEKFTVKGRSA